MGLDIIRNKGVEAIGRFYSTYRAVVIDDEDPMKLNRLLIHVPDITNNSVWAFPKHQPGSNGYGAKYLTPQKDEIVYVEFQTGDPEYPLWSYHGWAQTQTPSDLEGNKKAGFVTPNGNRVILDDEGNIVTIEINGNQKINISPDGINLSVEGSLVETIAGNPGNYEQSISGDSSINVSGNSEENVTGSKDISALQNVNISATQQANLEGTVAVNISSNGVVSISGLQVALGGSMPGGGGVSFNGGGNGGLPISSELVDKLNIIEQEINTLKELFATVPVTPMDGGKAAFASLAGSWGTPIELTDEDDISNPDVTQ